MINRRYHPMIEDVDIYQHPTPRTGQVVKELTLGDSHANAIKILYSLIKENILEFQDSFEYQGKTYDPAECYQSLVDVYTKDVNDLTAEDLKFFKAIIESLRAKDPIKLRFLGDELCDRGQNDYFVLLIFNQLNELGVDYDVIMSNHLSHFIKQYLNGFGEVHEENLDISYEVTIKPSTSMQAMGTLIKNNLIDVNEIEDLVEGSLLPNLKLCDYSLDEETDEILLFTHAPCGFSSIDELNLFIDSEHELSDLSSLEELKLFFNKINRKFLTLLDAKKFELLEEDPFFSLLWRRYREFNDPNENEFPFTLTIKDKTYHLIYVHGHDGSGNVPNSLKNHVINLDNKLGKSLLISTGTYCVLVKLAEPLLILDNTSQKKVSTSGINQKEEKVESNLQRSTASKLNQLFNSGFSSASFIKEESIEEESIEEDHSKKESESRKRKFDQSENYKKSKEGSDGLKHKKRRY